MLFSATLGYDDEARMWFTQSSNVPGLLGEAARVEDLIQQLDNMLPYLLTNVYQGKPPAKVDWEVVAHRGPELVRYVNREVSLPAEPFQIGAGKSEA